MSLPEKSNNNIIIEFGSNLIRGGFAGDNFPLFTIPMPVPEIVKLDRNQMRIKCLEILSMLFLNHLKVKSKDCQVLIIENMFSHKVLREELFNVLFQELQVQMVSFQPDLMMACLSTGARSGIVLDISASEIRCLAIAYGTPIIASYTTTSIGMSYSQTLFHQMFHYHCSSNNVTIPYFETIEDFYHRVACISPACINFNGECWNQPDDIVDGHHLPVDVYDFPPTNQARKVIIPGWMRSCCLLPIILGCNHIYFQPSIVSNILDSNNNNNNNNNNNSYQIPENNDEIGGAVGAVLTCLLKCSRDIRKYLLQHLIICGGGAAVPGVARTICSVLTELTGGWNKFQIKEKKLPIFERYVELESLSSPISPNDNIMPLWTPTLFDRDTFAWIGGSLFASIRGNTSRYIIREEFQTFHLKNTSKSNDDTNSLSSTPSSSSTTLTPSSISLSTPISSTTATTTTTTTTGTPSRIPDWMSLDPIDWRFYGSLGIHAAPIQQAKPAITKSNKTTSSSIISKLKSSK